MPTKEAQKILKDIPAWAIKIMISDLSKMPVRDTPEAHAIFNALKTLNYI